MVIVSIIVSALVDVMYSCILGWLKCVLRMCSKSPKMIMDYYFSQCCQRAAGTLLYSSYRKPEGLPDYDHRGNEVSANSVFG